MGFIGIVLEHHRRNGARAKNYKYFKACMACAALVAIADGRACRLESATLATLIKTLQDLNLYERSLGVEIYEDYVAMIEADPEAGTARVMEAIDQVRDEPEWAALLVAIGATVSQADGVVYESEVDAIEKICRRLAIDADTVAAFQVEIRNDLYE